MLPNALIANGGIAVMVITLIAANKFSADFETELSSFLLQAFANFYLTVGLVSTTGDYELKFSDRPITVVLVIFVILSSADLAFSFGLGLQQELQTLQDAQSLVLPSP
jgi:hypothetical protein